MVAISDAILNILTNSEPKNGTGYFGILHISNEHFDTKKSLLAAKLSWSGIFEHSKLY